MDDFSNIESVKNWIKRARELLEECSNEAAKNFDSNYLRFSTECHFIVNSIEQTVILREEVHALESRLDNFLGSHSGNSGCRGNCADCVNSVPTGNSGNTEG